MCQAASRSGWIESCATGMSAAGQPSISGTQAPWSRPRALSIVAPVSSATRAASEDAPGAGYCSR
jgi:hypothetical protein